MSPPNKGVLDAYSKREKEIESEMRGAIDDEKERGFQSILDEQEDDFWKKWEKKANFEEFIKQYPDKEESTKEIVEFLGEQFAKVVSPDRDYDYLISAYYSEIISELGFNGVLYPSVKLAGEGINVAIQPESVSKLKLVHVGECSLYKNKKQIFVGNDSVAKINMDGSLQYEKASDDVFVSRISVANK